MCRIFYIHLRPTQAQLKALQSGSSYCLLLLLMRSTQQAVMEHLSVLVTDLGPTGVQRDERVFKILKDEKLPLDKQLSEGFRRWRKAMGRELV